MVLHFVLILLLSQPGLSVETLTRQAQEALRMGKYAEARQKLQQALKASPHNPTLWNFLGLAYAQLNEVDPAIAAFEKVLSISPRNAPTFFNLGVLYGRKGDTAKALEVYRQGLALDPTDVPANQNYALLLMGAGRYREALDPLQKVKEAKPSDLPVRVALIECYLKGGMKIQGERETEDLLVSSIPTITDKLKLAQVLLADNEPDTAQRVLENAVASSPNSAEAHGELGLLLSKKNQFEEGVRELGRAVQLAPDSAKYSMGLAETLLLWNHNAAALEFLLAIKDRFAAIPEFQYKLALAYYSLHQYPTAISQLEKLAGQQPLLDLVQYFLGNSYMAMGDLKEAETYYRRSIELNPGKAPYYTSLAGLLRKQSDKNIEEAIGFLEKALVLDPADVPSHLQLGLCYEEKKDLEKAAALLERVTRLSPALLPAHVALARVYYHQGKKEEGDRERATVARLEAEEQTRQSQIGHASRPSQP